MSDRRSWLDETCPSCHAAPGARCRGWRWGRGRAASRRPVTLPYLHIERGWHARMCPTCKAPAGEECVTPSGRTASRIHTARLYGGRHELIRRSDVWAELARRGASIAVVPFWGRAGRGGETNRIRLSRMDGDKLVDVELWTGRDDLCFALEAPVWDRFGLFAGQPHISGEVLWLAEDHSVVITGTRSGKAFEETVR